MSNNIFAMKKYEQWKTITDREECISKKPKEKIKYGI